MTLQPSARSAESNPAQPDVTQPLCHAGIVGLGMCVPERIVTNDEIATMVDTSDEWITSRTGIRERRVSDAQTATSDLAVAAAQRA